MINKNDSTTKLLLTDVSRPAWFYTFIDYLEVRIFIAWVDRNPATTPESFSLAWPALLDGMLLRATRETAWRLSRSVKLSYN